MKLFASYLTDRLKTGRNIQNLQNWVKWGDVVVMSPTFGISGPPNISGTVKAGNFKFDTEMEGSQY